MNESRLMYCTSLQHKESFDVCIERDVPDPENIQFKYDAWSLFISDPTLTLRNIFNGLVAGLGVNVTLS